MAQYSHIYLSCKHTLIVMYNVMLYAMYLISSCNFFECAGAVCTTDNCHPTVHGPYNEEGQTVTQDVPVFQFLPVMRGTIQWIYCSISDYTFLPSVQLIIIGSQLEEFKLPQESRETQLFFEYSHYVNGSTGCGNISSGMHCYAFPITLISDQMDGAMVMCGARKLGCPTSFMNSIGIIRINETDVLPCPCTTTDSSITTDSSTTESNITTTDSETQLPVSDLNRQNITFKCTDAFNAIIGVSSLVIGFVIGLLSSLLIWCVATRMHCCTPCEIRHHQATQVGPMTHA